MRTIAVLRKATVAAAVVILALSVLGGCGGKTVSTQPETSPSRSTTPDSDHTGTPAGSKPSVLLFTSPG